ncbi:hypothetical protein GTQ99_02425 [Kineococcus sp. T13]|uniref:hypothetical protein n=1 Tax=Kineococcus vitellinus TaxID=2696565 RepID=UPI0014128C0C|nr:hypothetical protein [Kineococcus vitellinus]NAZ74284.1 hypothetical protein [Kineococcus vitellinus]
MRYADEEPHSFASGTRMRFGRDDAACQIPVWEQINGHSLSKVAGELWCTGRQMWVRNLSTAHELVVAGTSGSQLLPPRVGDEPGHACSVPLPTGTVSAPSTGAWSLSIEQLRPLEPEHGELLGAALTLRIDDIPDRHRQAAEALCAPLLAGQAAPATYAQIAERTGWSDRVARRRVQELCEHYRPQIQALPGGRLPQETLTQAVARTLVTRNKLTAPRSRTAQTTAAEEHG